MEKRSISALLFMLFICSNLYSQKWNWVQTIRPGGNEYTWDLATDPQGNILATGRVKATSTFGWSTNTVTPPAKSCCETDVFLAKYRPNGDLVWVKRDGGKYADWGKSVCSDKQSNIYITGDYCDTASFGSFQIIGVGSNTNRNIFIAKYDSSGTCLWVKTAGSTGANHSRGYSVDTDTSGNCYLAGHVAGPTNFGGVSFGTAGKNMPFLAKFSPTGTCMWVKTFNIQYLGEANEVKVDRNQNVIVTGNYRGNLYVGSTTYPGNSPSWSDVFIMKFDPNGNNIWTRTATGAYQDLPYALTIDSSNNIYTAGTFANDLKFGTTIINSLGWGTDATTANNGIDIFIAKYSSNGTFKWVKTIGNPGSVSVDDIEVTPANKILVAGSLSGNVTMSDTSLVLGANPWSFVTAYDTLGNISWFKLNGGGGNLSLARGIAINKMGDCYIGGEFTSGPSLAFDTISVQSLNGYDGYIAKLLPPLDSNLTASQSSLCSSGTVSFNTSQDGSAVSYQWLFPGGVPSASSLKDPDVFYSSPGTYNATLILHNSYSSDTIQHTIISNPSPMVDLGLDTTACTGSTVLLDAGNPSDTYLWSDGSVSQTLSVNSAGTFFVTVSNSSGCFDKDTIEVQFDICVGVNDSGLSDLYIGPNPAQDKFKIFYNGDASAKPASVRLFNSVGQEFSCEMIDNGAEINVSVADLSPGIYFYLITGGSMKNWSGTLIKQ